MVVTITNNTLYEKFIEHKNHNIKIEEGENRIKVRCSECGDIIEIVKYKSKEKSQFAGSGMRIKM